MNESTNEIILTSVFTGLMGYLLGTTLSDIDLRVSVILATAATYGVITWKKQHDYQQGKLDRKQLIKLVKISLALAFKSRGTRLDLARDIERHTKTKNNINKARAESEVDPISWTA